MKLWELVSVMREEKSLFLELLPSRQSEWGPVGEWIGQFDELVNAQDREKLDYELPNQLVRFVLRKSKRTYFLSHDGYLRPLGRSKTDKMLSALEAFDRYGGEPIENALEYGSVKVL